MGCFGLAMIYTLSTAKTHPKNANDDKRWETTKRLECQQGTTK
jgi:hypothetical protein